MPQELRVGVVGYCPPTRFDTAEARRLIQEAFDQIAASHPDHSITIVSGLTDVGVLSIAYAEAAEVKNSGHKVLEYELAAL